MVQGVCEWFAECEDIVGEILGIDEDNFPGQRTFLDESKWEEESEAEVVLVAIIPSKCKK